MSDDEWWDVLDADGEPTGPSFRRGADCWPAGRFHLIVAVCVQREDGAVLLTQRAARKEFAFGWEFPGGSAVTGETSRAAARREVREEAGLDLASSQFTLVDRFVERSALLDFYVARLGSTAELSLQEAEVLAAEWVSIGEVERRVRAGLMADPWVARLKALWPSITTALYCGR